MFKTILIIVLGVISIGSISAVAWLLTRPAEPKSYVGDYQTALARHSGSETAVDQGVDNFNRVYSNLSADGIGDKINTLYAENMYFNDTIKTVRNREQLTRYMESMGEMLKSSEVKIDQVIRDGEDVFIRWTMHFESRAAGKSVHSNTIGMSHLRFDEAGRIVLHQDFWDSATGIYRHMPVIGYLMDQADQRIGG